MTDVTIERAALEQALDALEVLLNEWTPAMEAQLEGVAALEVLRAALAAQPVKPVAWRINTLEGIGLPANWHYFDGEPAGESAFMVQPLYAASTAPAAAPLTNEQIDEIWDGTFRSEDPNRQLSFRQIITRAIERAHGIAVGDKP